jgi:capsular exopolysaccharide synthesis family protein
MNAVHNVSKAPQRQEKPRRGAFVDDPHLVVMTRPNSPVAERYRRVRLSIEQAPCDHPAHQVTVVTSAVPGEGKTTTAVNLALAYAEDPAQRTLLIDGDLRRPALSKLVSPEAAFGLVDVLAGHVPLDIALIEMTDSKLWVLPAGKTADRALEKLQQHVLAAMLAELRGRFDKIVIDTPPTVPFTDAAVLASHADGAVLVVRAGTTTAPLLQRARESLSAASLVGIVLNDVAVTSADRYYERYYAASDL